MSQKKKIKIITAIMGTTSLMGDEIISTNVAIPKIEEKLQEENEINHQQNLNKNKLKLNTHKVKRSPNDEKIINKIKNTSLGIIQNNRIDTILNAVLIQNPGIDINNLRVVATFTSYAVIRRHNETIFVNFITSNIRSLTTLRTNIQNTNLGILSNNNSDTIINRILTTNSNSNLNRNNFKIIEITKNNAVIINKNDKNDKIYINFNIVQEKLKRRAKKLDLEIVENNEDKIKQAIVQENPDIEIDELEITLIENTGNNSHRVSVISKNELDSEFLNTDSNLNQEFSVDNFINTNEIIFTFREPFSASSDKKNDKELFKNTNLGILSNNEPQTILNAIVERNPEINIESLILLNIGTRSATVELNEGTSSMTMLSTSVNFTLNENSSDNDEINICRRIQNTNLGTLKNDNLSTIKHKISLLVPDITKEKMTIISRTPTKIIVKSPMGKICIGGQISFNSISNSQINSLASIILNRNLGRIANNSNFSILNAVLVQNPGIDINNLRVESASENSAIIIGRLRSPYQGSVVVNFSINKKVGKKIRFNNSPIVNMASINKYNSIPKNVKENELKKINEYFNNLNLDDKKKFKSHIKDVGIGLTSSGITASGLIGISKMTGISPIKGLKVVGNYVNSKIASTTTTITEETELTPLLSEEEGLNIVETINVEGSGVITGETAVGSGVIAGEAAVGSGVIAGETAVGSGVIAGEAAVGSGVIAGEAAVGSGVIAGETTLSLSLAPETLGLSLIIGAIIIAGTTIWWINSSNSSEITTSIKHEKSNMYNISTIEKYYKFLAHDQLKLNINKDKWNNIKLIYINNSQNYDNFVFLVKGEFTELYKEDHTGWGGQISNEDLNTILKIIFNHFQEINNHFLTNDSRYSWKIVTNTIGSYFLLE